MAELGDLDSLTRHKKLSIDVKISLLALSFRFGHSSTGLKAAAGIHFNMSTKGMIQNRVHTTSSGILMVERDGLHFFSAFFSPGFGLYIVILSDISPKQKTYMPIYDLNCYCCCSSDDVRPKLFVGVAKVPDHLLYQ